MRGERGDKEERKGEVIREERAEETRGEDGIGDEARRREVVRRGGRKEERRGEEERGGER